MTRGQKWETAHVEQITKEPSNLMSSVWWPQNKGAPVQHMLCTGNLSRVLMKALAVVMICRTMRNRRISALVCSQRVIAVATSTPAESF